MSKRHVPVVVEPLKPSPGARRFTDDFQRDSVRLVADERYRLLLRQRRDRALLLVAQARVDQPHDIQRLGVRSTERVSMHRNFLGSSD